ncbi:antimicrobial peptide system SdpB family protein [Spirosoma lacussanchae]|uniref:sporulation-delaying protein SdpB family protein n=1 Tax=Spirosoma lacussanchae TaxID=1884249 RepID=UPI0011091725|nr:sporulation-delaying protein SdpB family protein [Spirosoma lacussanchae]
MKVGISSQFNIWVNDQLSTVDDISFLGISRSLLALSTMLTLLCNGPEIIFANLVGDKMTIKEDLIGISLFYLLGCNHVKIAYLVALCILFIVIIGILPRYTAALHWWVSYSLFSSGQVLDGGDQITNILTLFMMPILWLYDTKWHWQTKRLFKANERVYTYFFVILMKMQFCFLYFQAATSKFLVPEWKNGTAVYYWLNNRAFGNKDVFLSSVLTSSALGVVLLTWGTILIELILSAGFFMSSRYWDILFWIGVLFHLFILIAMGLTSFSIAMSAGLIIYFQPRILSRLAVPYKTLLS